MSRERCLDAHREAALARAEVDEVRKALRAESRFCAEARAEVAALREQVVAFRDALRGARDEENALRDRVRVLESTSLYDEGARDVLADLRTKWNDEGHAVMFNHAKDDLTPAQRVGKWLEEETR